MASGTLNISRVPVHPC